jgi:hypothetical protein
MPGSLQPLFRQQSAQHDAKNRCGLSQVSDEQQEILSTPASPVSKTEIQKDNVSQSGAVSPGDNAARRDVEVECKSSSSVIVCG